MKAINKQAQKVFEKMTEGMGVGDVRVIDRAPGLYMPIEVVRLSERTYRIGHYYEQNGDRVQDPEVYLHAAEVREGERRIRFTYPTAIWHAIGARQVVAEQDSAGSWRIYPCAQREVAEFVGVWFSNVKQQQGL